MSSGISGSIQRFGNFVSSAFRSENSSDSAVRVSVVAGGALALLAAYHLGHRRGTLQMQAQQEQAQQEQAPQEQVPQEQVPQEQVPQEQVPQEQVPQEQVPQGQAQQGQAEMPVQVKVTISVVGSASSSNEVPIDSPYIDESKVRTLSRKAQVCIANVLDCLQRYNVDDFLKEALVGVCFSSLVALNCNDQQVDSVMSNFEGCFKIVRRIDYTLRGEIEKEERDKGRKDVLVFLKRLVECREVLGSEPTFEEISTRFEIIGSQLRAFNGINPHKRDFPDYLYPFIETLFIEPIFNLPSKIEAKSSKGLLRIVNEKIRKHLFQFRKVHERAISMLLSSVYDTAQQNRKKHECIGLLLNEVTSVGLSDELTRVELSDEDTRVELSDEDTRVELSDEDTRVELSDEDTRVELSDEDTRVELSDEDTRVKLSDEDTRVELSDEDTRVKLSNIVDLDNYIQSASKQFSLINDLAYTLFSMKQEIKEKYIRFASQVIWSIGIEKFDKTLKVWKRESRSFFVLLENICPYLVSREYVAADSKVKSLAESLIGEYHQLYNNDLKEFILELDLLYKKFQLMEALHIYEWKDGQVLPNDLIEYILEAKKYDAPKTLRKAKELVRLFITGNMTEFNQELNKTNNTTK